MKNHSMEDAFTISGEVDSLTQTLIDHLRAVGFKANRIEHGVQARSGSDLVFRLFGAAIPLGARNMPIGMDVQILPEKTGTVVQSFAYDRLGWYANDKLVWGGEEIVNEKLTSLLGAVRTALGSPSDPDG